MYRSDLLIDVKHYNTIVLWDVLEFELFTRLFGNANGNGSGTCESVRVLFRAEINFQKQIRECDMENKIN